ncbi:hypothetical protein ACIQRK_24060 [Streptomyces anulatus]
MRPPGITELFPGAGTATVPFEVPVGIDFDVLSLPLALAVHLFSSPSPTRDQYVGAAIYEGDVLTLILPPSSGIGLNWSPLVKLRSSGTLTVPPLKFTTEHSICWARRGNLDGRVFTAPLCIYPLVGADAVRGQESSGGRRAVLPAESPLAVLLSATRSGSELEQRDLVLSPSCGALGAAEMPVGGLPAVGVGPVVARRALVPSLAGPCTSRSDLSPRSGVAADYVRKSTCTGDPVTSRERLSFPLSGVRLAGER